MPSFNTDAALWPAYVLSAEIGARRLSPVDLVDALLARISAADGKLHASAEVYGEEARLAAEAADKAIRSEHAIGPLHGIPIALKDLIEIEGRVTTGGSQVWRDRRSACTATLAQRLVAAGLIVRCGTFSASRWGFRSGACSAVAPRRRCRSMPRAAGPGRTRSASSSSVISSREGSARSKCASASSIPTHVTRHVVSPRPARRSGRNAS